MTIRYPTKNDLPEESRSRLIELLDAQLASSIDLALSAKQAHWNVRGPRFQFLHELFDQVHAQASGWSDLLAERVAQLGGGADGTSGTVARRTGLPRYPTGISSGRDHLEAMSGAVATFGKSIRAAIRTADAAQDAGSADLFTEISRGSDKMLWFLEAHLQGEAAA